MSSGKKIFSNFAWSAIERLSVQFLQLLIGIILARILGPEEFGLLGILMVFIAFSRVFIDSGFAYALIQKTDRTQSDIATAFTFNLVISILCYIILWFTAPLISSFYNLPEITSYLRVLSVVLIINALFTIPTTLLTIAQNFKLLTKINLTTSLISGVCAVILAYLDYGVWALIIQLILKGFLTLAITNFATAWRPKIDFNKESFKALFGFGSNLLAATLLNSVVDNIYNLFIAKKYSARDLGIYSKGTQFADYVFNIIAGTNNRVIFPSLTGIQNDTVQLSNKIKSIIKNLCLLITPVYFLLALLSKPLVIILLTDKWIEAIPIMQLICLARLITNISGVNVSVLYILGKTRLVLKQQLLKLAVRVILLFAALEYGIYYIALAELVSTIIHFFINTYYPGKIMKLGAIQQIREVSPFILSGILMSVVVILLNRIIPNLYLQLLINTFTGLLVYLLSIKILKVKELNFLYAKFLEFLKPPRQDEIK